MCSQFQMARVLRLSITQYVNTNYIQTRQMARRGSPLVYKAIQNEDGKIMDTSRLGQLKKNIEYTSSQPETFIKPVSMPNQRKIKEEYSSNFKPINPDSKHNEKKKKGEDYSSNFKSRKPGSTPNEWTKKGENKDYSSILKQVQKQSEIKSKKKEEVMSMTEEEIEKEEEELINQSIDKRGFHIPHYSKIYGWDKKNKHLKELGKSLSQNNTKSEYVVLEGTRLINDALNSGLQPNTFIFSQVKLLKEIQTQKIDSACDFFQVPYSNVKMWSDLTTPTGVMAAFDKSKIIESAKPTNPLPITLICDNVRTPDNLGSILRVAGAAGVNKILLTPGCVSPWNRKVLRSGAGIHFKVPIVEKLDWEEIKKQIDSYPQVVICDICSENESSMSEEERSKRLHELQQPEPVEDLDDDDDEEEDDDETTEANLLAKYRQIPITTVPFNKFRLNPGVKDVVIVVGGETEGVSDAAYKFSHDLNGSRLHIPLRNEVNSLNVISATSVALFTIQQQFDQ